MGKIDIKIKIEDNQPPIFESRLENVSLNDLGVALAQIELIKLSIVGEVIKLSKIKTKRTKNEM